MAASTHFPVVCSAFLTGKTASYFFTDDINRYLRIPKAVKEERRMNYYVPDFEMDDDAALPTPSSTLTRPKKSSSSTPEEEIMELLWQNGQVVMQSQTQRSVKKSPPPPSRYEDAVLPADQSTAAPTEIQSSHHQQQSNHLFMQEDEMASWLHYPLQEANFDHDFCADLLYPPSAPCVTSATTVNTGGPARSTIQHPDLLRPPVAAARPPIPPARRPEAAVQNFPYFSRHNRGRIIGAGGGFGVSETGPSSLRSVVRESTVVDSCVTPTTIGSDARISEVAGRSAAGGASSGGDNTYGTMSGAVLAPTFSGATVGAGTEMMTTTCEMTVTSSTGGSSGSAEPQTQKPPVDYRKRKGREEDAECHSEDAEFESAGTKKQGRGSSSIKRSRAAEVHNLSERRRRDRINEKMKALQELIPRCNKSDKASMLDEAIEYLKSLQLQVQMMSMGCSMVPMMFPGIQQYMPPMGMGMGMGMGMEMGMNRPMMPFHNMLPGAPSPNPAAAAQLGPRFPMPAFHMPPVPPSDPTRIQAVNQSDPMLGSIGVQNGNQPRVPNFSDPYQRYLGLHQMQLPIPQNQTMLQPSTSKPSTSRGAEDRGNQPSG